MTAAGYEIARYRPEHFEGVLTVLAGLWPWERELAASFFRWRHVENPYVDAPLGIVALHAGQVVGFRGYFALAYSPGAGHADIVVLHPCDTVVDPAHRNQGLSVMMGRSASEFDPTRYRLLMNLSSSGNSRPGYLALGFVPLTNRVQLHRHGLNPFAWLAAARRCATPAGSATSWHCPPSAMASMRARSPSCGGSDSRRATRRGRFSRGGPWKRWRHLS